MDLGSFRDPAGSVFYCDDRVFRTIHQPVAEDFKDLQASGALKRLVDGAGLWPAEPVPMETLPQEARLLAEGAAELVVEHPKIPFISYPYEWPFGLLKRAAIFHLDLHLKALKEGFHLIDGSAFNVQFDHCRPVFIDTLSLRKYQEGDYWLGYRQFCEQFLNPLLISAKLGVPFHPWYRGALEGIAIKDTNAILPWGAKLRPGIFMHVVLHSRLSTSAVRKDQSGSSVSGGLSKRSLVGLLSSLKSTIASLQPKDVQKTTWADYEKNHSYQDDEVAAKKRFVAEFVEQVQPKILWDLGCNSGDYSEQALASGTERVIGFDFDPGALEVAISRADEKQLNFLPLILDATNPTPSQGWNQKERMGLAERANADGLIALAFVHHLVIGKNVPLEQALAWLVSLSPRGVIEFVPKNDPMVQTMLASREDIFDFYDITHFRDSLSSMSDIVREQTVSASGRTLFQYTRTGA